MRRQYCQHATKISSCKNQIAVVCIFLHSALVLAQLRILLRIKKKILMRFLFEDPSVIPDLLLLSHLLYEHLANVNY